jgi:hypothetical protein
MKRIALLTILLVSVVFLLPTYAGKPAPEPEKTVISDFYEYSFSGEASQVADFELLASVPQGQVFVLTDVRTERLDSQGTNVKHKILEDTILKYFAKEDIVFNLISGINFASGSTVHIEIEYPGKFPDSFYDGRVFASGYLMPSP